MLPLLLAAVLFVGLSPSLVTAEPSTRGLLGGVSRAVVEGFANTVEPYRGGDFNLSTSAATPFVQKLLASARDVSNAERITFAGDGDVIPLEVQRSLCEASFLRGAEDSGFDAAEVDESYAASYPQRAGGNVPVGCVEGCIIGSGVFEGIARYYGIARTLTPSSWQGKCFSEDTSPVPENPGPDYKPGTKVTNRIKVNYGAFLNRLLGLDEPLTLYEGKTRLGESWFAENQDAVIVEYDVLEHEFTGFRDELREVYPGAYIGKMYALPGASLWNGAFEVPEGEPAFTVNFMVFANPNGSYMPAVGTD
tara:strand:+ start:2746 stop:3666 length:921 start_codon:yes stop_codon:yes gene_type:complete